LEGEPLVAQRVRWLRNGCPGSQTLAVARQITWGGHEVRLERGDITIQPVDAIVSAANTGLRGGGGVDGAIHAAAGPALLEELVTSYPDGTRTGSAVLTGAGNLPARWVIHAVGPRWSGGNRDEPALLASAYSSSLDRAAEAGARTVAFPAISCGIYGYPLDGASEVALASVRSWLEGHPVASVTTVTFVLRGGDVMGAFERALAAAGSS
jgi:O-acetyl-ADP-ribose deacetylase (regulator of RNase III)